MAVTYVSTRGAAAPATFEDVLLAGLAPDGGLYLPSAWPQLADGLARHDYPHTAAAVLAPFVDDCLTLSELTALSQRTYAGFDHPATAPLVQIGPDRWLLELVHGPTLAFKDYAMQLLGRLFEAVLERRGERVTIIGATSGDTGAAAVGALAGLSRVDVAILHPWGRVSEVQRRQMTTCTAANVTNVAIEGTFDDCQDLVKAMFNDRVFNDELRLSGINSINWARIAAQAVYYVYAAARLQGPVSFVVPTGNFGNVFAGYVARAMGAPVDRLVVATNLNDILARFFQTRGAYEASDVAATLSPSMDIQVASNFERALYEASGCDPTTVHGWMKAFAETRRFAVDDAAFAWLSLRFAADRVDEATTRARIRRSYEHGLGLIDPHTAVGLDVADRIAADGPVVTLATAHPAKFPDAAAAAGVPRAELPPSLADLYDRPEQVTRLSNDLAQVQAHIRRWQAER